MSYVYNKQDSTNQQIGFTYVEIKNNDNMKTCSSFSRRMVKKEKAIRGPWFMSIWQNAIIFLCHSPIKIFHFTFINHSKSFSPKKISNPSDLEDIFSLHFFSILSVSLPIDFFYQLYNVVWGGYKTFFPPPLQQILIFNPTFCWWNILSTCYSIFLLYFLYSRQFFVDLHTDC